MLALFGAQTQKRIYIKLKLFREGQLDGHKIPILLTLGLLKCKINSG